MRQGHSLVFGKGKGAGSGRENVDLLYDPQQKV